VQDPVAAAILKARTRAGLTQEELAKRLHTDQGNIARLERSRSQATVRTLRRIADATEHELIINFRRASRKG
jgi:transcriptional regulator with XRE-family HTH domain